MRKDYPYPNPFITGYSFNNSIKIHGKYSQYKQITHIWKQIEFHFFDYSLAPTNGEGEILQIAIRPSNQM